jgi:uncharacterized protein (UPF0264 family)
MKLLVSVRSAEEALAALEGGADLIDVKEPFWGSLGKAEDEVIVGVVRAVGSRRPVSAAMGELVEFGNSAPPAAALAYLKWGLSKCRDYPWREQLLKLQAGAQATVVPTAYADADRARAPAVEEIAQFAASAGFPVVLIDTWRKDDKPIFSWLSPDALAGLARRLHDSHIELALAGSLSNHDLPALRRINADWMAVRGCVCFAGKREAAIDEMHVRLLRWFIDHESEQP